MSTAFADDIFISDLRTLGLLYSLRALFITVLAALTLPFSLAPLRNKSSILEFNSSIRIAGLLSSKSTDSISAFCSSKAFALSLLPTAEAFKFFLARVREVLNLLTSEFSLFEAFSESLKDCLASSALSFLSGLS